MKIEPKLILVENFDELKVGMAVWTINTRCCGRNTGRCIIVNFLPDAISVDPDRHITRESAFSYLPKHICEIFKESERYSSITKRCVAGKRIFVEVLELGNEENNAVKAPKKIPARIEK
jgi:hypothetical protein